MKFITYLIMYKEQESLSLGCYVCRVHRLWNSGYVKELPCMNTSISDVYQVANSASGT
jgi:hypothetical protein